MAASQTQQPGVIMRRGFELALRLLTGGDCSVATLQQDLGVSRATAYRYLAVIRAGAAATVAPVCQSLMTLKP